MNLNELHETVAEIAAKNDRLSPFYRLRVEISRVGDETRWIYSCYMDPGHRTHEEFSSPEDLIDSLRRGFQEGPVVRGKPIDGDLEVTG